MPEAAPGPAHAPEPSAPAGTAPAAAHWLGYLQDQFARVAQAAITPTAPKAAAPAAKATAKAAARRPAAKRRRAAPKTAP
jgi:hypothetical protein